MALDELTNITDSILLSIQRAKCCLFKEFELTTEVASMNSPHETTTGENISKVEKTLIQHNLK